MLFGLRLKQPKALWEHLLGCYQACPPSVRQSLNLVQPFCVELLVGRRAWLDLLEAGSNIVYKCPPGRGSMPLLYQG
jgi:hypothetical protein